MLGRTKKAITTPAHEQALAARAAATVENPLNGILDRDPGVVTAQQKLAALMESAAEIARRIADLTQRAEAVPNSDSLADADAESVGEVVRQQMESAATAAAELARLRIQAKWLQDAIAQQRNEIGHAYRRAVTPEIREMAANAYEGLVDRLWAKSQETLAAAEAERQFIAVQIGGGKTIGNLVRVLANDLCINTNAGSYRAQHERLRAQMAKRHTI